jgi:hypothetical protein
VIILLLAELFINKILANTSNRIHLDGRFWKDVPETICGDPRKHSQVWTGGELMLLYTL